eukprot:TRINITY_DN24571_c0_g1_i3.p1 TRINITY_DN24571_c0_g1~~TRINITY_DN24571_c0_g1_i3.p1  ORF type:complete len:179 (+),score=59.35 TRINITY_DN24571_c0_g1_i3:31-537(+)
MTDKQDAASPTPEGQEQERRFGSNSYHYWHDHGKERAASGDVAPMPVPKLVAKEECLEQKRRVVAISKYSWGDGKKIVSVYIDMKGVGALQDKVTATHKARSICVTVAHEDHDAVLKLVRLNQRIKGVGLKFKDDQLVVKLEKEDTDTKWYDLHKTTMRGVTGSDSDE